MNEDLWKRFERTMDTSRISDKSPLSMCYSCPHATKTEKTAPRPDPKRYPGLDLSWYAPVDRSEYKPTKDDPACLSCFKGWVEEQLNTGKICIKCQKRITTDNPAAITIEERYAEGPHKGSLRSKHAICQQCFEPILEARIREAKDKRGRSRQMKRRSVVASIPLIVKRRMLPKPKQRKKVPMSLKGIK